MKIDVTQPLKNYDGTSIMQGDGTTPELARTYLIEAVMTPTKPDPERPGQMLKMTAEEKQNRHRIAKLLAKDKHVELAKEDKNLLLACIDVRYENPLVCGRLEEVLDGETQEAPTPPPKPKTRTS